MSETGWGMLTRAIYSMGLEECVALMDMLMCLMVDNAIDTSEWDPEVLKRKLYDRINQILGEEYKAMGGE